MLKKIFILFIFLFTDNVLAKGSISIIRDAEIEDFLKEISAPIFKSAGLNKNNIKFYIVNDNKVNAFVSRGQNIFINTGTLVSFDTPDAILGIIAHETGHIAAGHIFKTSEEIKGVQNVTIGSILLGIGALVAGAPEIGQTVIFGGLQIQQQGFLKYTRSQEEVADDLAIRYLSYNHLSSSALLESMDKFYMNELQFSNESEYYSTHPLSRNRREFIKNKIKKERFTNHAFNKKYKKKFNFIKAKILAYNQSSNSNIKINFSKDSDYAIYANSIIDMNKGYTESAIRNIDYLIKKYKNNPYFYELKGDIYLKGNSIESALLNYNKTDNILKNNLLIKKSIAFIIIKYDKKEMYDLAINNLNYISKFNKDDSNVFKLLAEVYYKKNNLALSYFNLSKYYLNLNDIDKARKYIKLAEQNTEDENLLKKINDLKFFIDKKEKI